MFARKKREKKIKTRICQEAIVIFSMGSVLYAEILKDIKTDSILKDLGGNFSWKNSDWAKLTAFLTKLRTHLGIISQYSARISMK